MSEVVVVALISLIGTIAGASINAYASIKSSSTSSKSKSRSKRSSQVNKPISKKLITGAATGFILGLLVAVLLLSMSMRNVDLGSGLRIERSEKSIGQGTVKVYSHYPVGTIQYIDVNPDDALQRVDAVCLGIFKRNVTPFFASRDGSPRSNYSSSPLAVPGFCRIDFTVYDELGGGYIGISLWAEYVQ